MDNVADRSGVRDGPRHAEPADAATSGGWLHNLPPGRVSLVCGLVALAAGLIAQWVSRRPQLHLSQLLNVADSDPLAAYIAKLDPGFLFVTGVEHYDGVYYYAIARDPFALGQAHDLIDLAAYRYGSPLYGWLAGLFSFGYAPLLPVIFWLLSLASLCTAAVLVSRLVLRLGGSPWWGLAVAATPGMLYSSSAVLTEPLQVALVFGVLLAWSNRDRGNPWLLGGLLVATCLTKQPLVLVPVALFGHLLFDAFRGHRPKVAHVLALAAGPAAYGIWTWAIRSHFSAEQLAYDSGNIGVPLAGWLETFNIAGSLRVGDFYASQIGSTAPSALVATAATLLIGTVAGLARRDGLGFVVALQSGLVLCLGWRTLLFPHEMFRIPAVPLVLALASIGVGLAMRPDARRVETPAPS